jgi:hypothetical protein
LIRVASGQQLVAKTAWRHFEFTLAIHNESKEFGNFAVLDCGEPEGAGSEKTMKTVLLSLFLLFTFFAWSQNPSSNPSSATSIKSVDVAPVPSPRKDNLNNKNLPGS